ncbi:hypothetical protein pb186bvf_002842 [Paramecium bursaria]
MGCKESQIIVETEEINSLDESMVVQTRHSIIHQTNEHKAMICRYNQLSPDSTDLSYSPQLLVDLEVGPISIQQIISPQNTIKHILIEMNTQKNVQENKEINETKETKAMQQIRKQKQKKKKRVDMKDLEKLF